MHTGSPPPPGPPSGLPEGGVPLAGLVPLTGLVLCGGESRRMGTDKAVLEVGNVRLLDVVARRLATVADPVLVAPGRPGRLGPLPWPEVADARPGCGPLGGIVAGLEASPHELSAVVAVDLPLVDGGLLAWLARRSTGEEAIVPVDEDGRRQPLCAVYTRAAAPLLRGALDDGDLAVGRALSRLRVRFVAADEWTAAGFAPGWSRNVNTPDDLAALDDTPA